MNINIGGIEKNNQENLLELKFPWQRNRILYPNLIQYKGKSINETHPSEIRKEALTDEEQEKVNTIDHLNRLLWLYEEIGENTDLKENPDNYVFCKSKDGALSFIKKDDYDRLLPKISSPTVTDTEAWNEFDSLKDQNRLGSKEMNGTSFMNSLNKEFDITFEETYSSIPAKKLLNTLKRKVIEIRDEHIVNE